MSILNVLSTLLWLERDAFQAPRGALSNTWKWIIQGDTLVDEARHYWKGATWEESSKVRGTQDCSASWFTVLGFMEEGLISGLSLPHHLACVHVWSDSGLFQVACKSPGEARFQHESFREVGRTYYSPASPPSFRPLPNSLGWQQLVISLFLIGTFPWETTCASGCFHPWSGQKVSVHGSLTLFHLNAKVDLLLTIFQMKKQWLYSFLQITHCMLGLP